VRFQGMMLKRSVQMDKLEANKKLNRQYHLKELNDHTLNLSIKNDREMKTKEFEKNQRDRINNRIKNKIDQSKRETEDEISNFEKTLERIKAPLENDIKIKTKEKDPVKAELLRIRVKKAELEFEKREREKRKIKFNVEIAKKRSNEETLKKEDEEKEKEKNGEEKQENAEEE
jgi:hypothetical protein